MTTAHIPREPTPDELAGRQSCARRLRQLRKAAKATQAAVALAGGLSPQGILKLEQGAHRVRRSTLQDVLVGLRAVGAPVDDSTLDELVDLLGESALAPETPRAARRCVQRRARREGFDITSLERAADLLWEGLNGDVDLDEALYGAHRLLNRAVVQQLRPKTLARRSPQRSHAASMGTQDTMDPSLNV